MRTVLKFILVITFALFIISCGDDEQLFGPPKEYLEIKGLKSNQTELEYGETTTITAVIEYSGDELFLSYQWSSTFGSIAGSGKSAVYIALDEPGTQTITLTVTDGEVIAQEKVNITVKPPEHQLIIGENTHWQAVSLNNVLRYDVEVDEIFREKVELRYDIIQDTDESGAWLSIAIDGKPVLEDKTIGVPFTQKRIIERIDVSDVISAPGQYTIEFSLRLTNLVKQGWLLNAANIIGVEGTSERK